MFEYTNTFEWLSKEKYFWWCSYDIYQQSLMVPANVWPLGPTWINHVKSVYTHPFLLFIGQGSIIASSNSKKDRFDWTAEVTERDKCVK